MHTACVCGLDVTGNMPCHSVDEMTQFRWLDCIARTYIVATEVRETNGIRYKVLRHVPG